MAGLGGFHTSRPFLQRSDAALTSRLRSDISDFERARVREREKADELLRKAEVHKKELEKIRKANKMRNQDGEKEVQQEGDEDNEEDPMQSTLKPAKTAKEKDPGLQVVQQQAKGQVVEDSFRRGSHFGAKHLRTAEFGTQPMSERVWERNSEPIFVSLKPLAALPVEGAHRLAGHVPKSDKGFWRRTPGAINKVPEASPKRTVLRLDPADHSIDPYDHPPARSWLHEEPIRGDPPESGLMSHTFTSYARRKRDWPRTDQGRGLAPPLWAI